MKYVEIKTCDFYGRADSLDGEKIMSPGMRSLKFKDGTGGMFSVFIERTDEEAQVDMNNHPDHYIAHRAYIREFVHGHPVKLYLRENGIFIGVKEE